jgi:hypothetical protein
MIYQKIVPDVYMFCSIMFTRVVSNFDVTLIVIKEENLVHSVTIVL